MPVGLKQAVVGAFKENLDITKSSGLKVALDQGTEARWPNRVAHVTPATQEARIGEHRVRAIEHAQLCGLKWTYVVGKLRTACFPLGTRSHKFIFDHPLLERLGDYRALIFNTQYCSEALEIRPDELVTAPAEWRARLAAYWAARDRFIEAGRNVQPTPDVRRMLAQVREPLLAVLRISPDFRPAYDPLLRMALALERTDAAASRALLKELELVRAIAAQRLPAE